MKFEGGLSYSIGEYFYICLHDPILSYGMPSRILKNVSLSSYVNYVPFVANISSAFVMIVCSSISLPGPE